MNLGWPEILTVLVIALIIFGPRKLPELGKTLGQALTQFRKASDDFKRTWEDEVEAEKLKLQTSVAIENNPLWPPGATIAQLQEAGAAEYAAKEVADQSATSSEADPSLTAEPAEDALAESAEASLAGAAEESPATAQQDEAVAEEAKRDWM
ncbi:MAG: twin-arginine translocase TatA/TatE family subunit [Blastocatellia bacterium]|nr:twin-arginine translocase TatA/TatE family subunit [Blastocatellia bacterium]